MKSFKKTSISGIKLKVLMRRVLLKFIYTCMSEFSKIKLKTLKIQIQIILSQSDVNNTSLENQDENNKNQIPMTALMINKKKSFLKVLTF